MTATTIVAVGSVLWVSWLAALTVILVIWKG